MEMTMKLGNARINIEYLYGALEPARRRESSSWKWINRRWLSNYFKIARFNQTFHFSYSE